MVKRTWPLKFEPRERAGGNAGGAFGASIFGREKEGVGKYFLLPDADGDLWDLDWPMLMVDYPSAVGYAEWLSKKQVKNGVFLLNWNGKRRQEVQIDESIHGVIFLITIGPMFMEVWKNYPDTIYSFESDISPYRVRGMVGILEIGPHLYFSGRTGLSRKSIQRGVW